MSSRARWPERARRAAGVRGGFGGIRAGGLALLLGACAAAMPAVADDAVTAKEPAATSCDEAVAERVLRQCQACHALEKGQGHATGPNLFGVYGRKAGKIAGFNFSADLKAAVFRWDAQHLDAFLRNPRQSFPNTRMAFGGLSSATDRQALICHFEAQVAAGRSR